MKGRVRAGEEPCEALGPAPPRSPGRDGTSPRTAGKDGGGLRGHAWGSLAESTGFTPLEPRGDAAARVPPARMKRLCEESSSDTESDGTIDVGREEEYR